MTPSSTGTPQRLRLDPVYRHARRETAWIIGLCFFFLGYTLIVCGWLGYGPSDSAIDPETGPEGLTLGMPTWVFWGLLIPWITILGVTLGFSAFVMRDDSLESPHDVPVGGTHAESPIPSDTRDNAKEST